MEDLLLKELDVRFAHAGFRRVKSYGEVYCRESSGIRHTIGIGTRPYREALEAEIPNANVRFDAVEDLVAKFDDPHPLLGPEAIASRATLTVEIPPSDLNAGDPLNRWGGTNRKIWLIHAAEEVADVASQMAVYGLDKCEPMFASLSNIDNALAALSGEDQKSRTYAGPDEVRAKKAIALAFLSRGTGIANELATVKMARLKGDARAELKRWTERFFENAEGKR